MRKPISIIILLLFLLVAGSERLQAWSYHTHRKITADAIRLMPESFRRNFAGKKNHFLKGSTDPDTLIKDFFNHVYHPDGSATGGLERIQELFDKTVIEVRSGKDLAATAYLLGLMSHYIADINQPLHTAGHAADPNESEYHSQYEREINPTLKTLTLPQIEYRPVTSVAERVMAMADAANRYYFDIGTAYRSGRGLADLKEMTERQIAASTQQVVDFWLGVYLAAGHSFSETAAMALNDETAEDWQSETTPTNSPANNSSEAKININSASAAEMARFFNISPLKAERIVKNRPYHAIFALAKVEGLNVYFVRRYKDRIKLK